MRDDIELSIRVARFAKALYTKSNDIFNQKHVDKQT